MPIKHVVHIITGLNTGGAEMMLFKLLASMDKKEVEHHIISLLDEGTIGVKIKSLGIPVYALKMRGTLGMINALATLFCRIRRINPDLVQGWMYHGNLAASLAGIFVRKNVKVLWNIRHSLSDIGAEKRLTILLVKAGARLSGFPAKILYNSYAAALQHEKLGYSQDKTHVIPNGFDLQQFRPDVDAKITLRQELSVDFNTPLIGLIARFHPTKDFNNFLQAAALVHQKHSSARFVLVGKNVDTNNREIVKKIQQLALEGGVSLLGERSDIPQITAALDIAVNASKGEAFPNVVGEAMACSVPCVVTNVGDSARIVGDTGKVVPPCNPEALAGAISELLEMRSAVRQNLGKTARQRITDLFSIQHVASEYEALYKNYLQ